MTATLTASTALVPTGDRAPVENAVVGGIADGFGPETFLWVEFHRPDGGMRIKYVWTDGGQQLGDRIDSLAMTAGMDTADWLHVADRHEMVSSRGRLKIKAYPLRPVLADVQGGVRAPEELRESVRRLLRVAGEITGQVPRTLTPRWMGFGPVLANS
ncbi:hypothetical protein [Streptomyces violaceusniger]|uniref:Uncharacterized protein n=1 Tax=Streptomyces violaceusniger (strain Tu 4113) TaxID=653045 RepID=G2PHL5_STRV4|nr:hypothetical protein [Streptomyces violaceusniger]AEM89018.1 hypothetical protein Strvi_0245 [Streptomyces violaceusniger Tu 4113]